MAELQFNNRVLNSLGVLFIILGVLAILLPFAAALTIELIIGSLLVAGSLIQIVHAVHLHQEKGFWAALFTGILFLMVGIMLLAHPLRGVITLTLLLAIFFILEGIFKICAAIQWRDTGNWSWMLISGILALVIGLLVWSQWPGSASWVIGLFLGIDLIFGGLSFVMLSAAKD